MRQEIALARQESYERLPRPLRQGIAVHGRGDDGRGLAVPAAHHVRQQAVFAVGFPAEPDRTTEPVLAVKLLVEVLVEPLGVNGYVREQLPGRCRVVAGAVD